MPKRTDKKVEVAELQTFTYEDLLKRIRNYIDVTYDGVANFLKHSDLEKCGFGTDSKEAAKMYTYLALPKEGAEGRRTKSFPVVQKLYKGLLGIDIESDIVVTRMQVIKGDGGKIEKLPLELAETEG